MRANTDDNTGASHDLTKCYTHATLSLTTLHACTRYCVFHVAPKLLRHMQASRSGQKIIKTSTIQTTLHKTGMNADFTRVIRAMTDREIDYFKHTMRICMPLLPPALAASSSNPSSSAGEFCTATSLMACPPASHICD
jgi:hypothetical protein